MLRVVELGLEQQFADVHVRIQLLSNFALERLDVCLAARDLAARKLPHTGQVRAFEPARDQEQSSRSITAATTDDDSVEAWETNGTSVSSGRQCTLACAPYRRLRRSPSAPG